MILKIIPLELLDSFMDLVDEDLINSLNEKPILEIPVDYFKFYTSVSSVYSSKIEGEEIDFDSYFKYKFLNVKFKPDFTKKADDLYNAYEFIFENPLNLENLKKAHSILSSNLLPEIEQGRIRNNPMFVINEKDQIEYVAAEPMIVMQEIEKFFYDIEILLNNTLSEKEIFYFASFIHLVFVKIHPFQDGNGRMARLIEKWFLKEKIGEKAVSVPLERYYYQNLKSYYSNIKKLGFEYNELDYSKAMDFLLMTINSLKK
ncbi:MAG TPA: Fic family protein [Tenuifilaceae bacterium]|nr:Fic family protein [Tenuifilaceae bacterium]